MLCIYKSIDLNKLPRPWQIIIISNYFNFSYLLNKHKKFKNTNHFIAFLDSYVTKIIQSTALQMSLSSFSINLSTNCSVLESLRILLSNLHSLVLIASNCNYVLEHKGYCAFVHKEDRSQPRSKLCR